MKAVWQEPHDKKLRTEIEAGASFADAAASINRMFNTSYSRNAAIGRAGRLKIKSTRTSGSLTGERSGPRNRKRSEDTGKTRSTAPPRKLVPQFACDETGLRIADVISRNISIGELTELTCKWPFGNASPFTFCGCEAFDGGPYCGPHLALSTGPGSRGEQMAARGLQRVA